MNTNITIDDIFQILNKDENYYLQRLITSPIPDNDYDYINLWFNYFSLVQDEIDLINNYLKNLEVRPEDFKFTYELKKKIKKNAKSVFDEKISKINFKSRIDQYIQKFNLEEQEEIKKLILSFFYDYSQREYHSPRTILELGKYYNIKYSVIYSISDDHSLVRDKIFYVEDGILNKNKPFLEKELYYKPAIYKIFANLKLSDSDIASVGDSPLLQEFSIIEPEYFHDHLSVSEIDEKFDTDEDEFGSLEDLLKNNNAPPLRDDENLNAKGNNRQEVKEGKSEIREYDDDIDYLYEESRWIVHLFQLREKQENKNEYRYKSEITEFEIEQNLRKQKNLCSMRLQKSISNGFEPRVEKISAKLKLNDFEKNVIKILTINKIFPFKIDEGSGSDSDSSYRVSDLLNLFIDEAKNRVREKKSFLRNSKLVKYNLIQVIRNNSLDETINSSRVTIDNRLLEYLGGEDFDFADYFEGGLLYKSKIKFDSVILSESKKLKITENIDNFPIFLKAKKNLDFSDTIQYGNSLVMLFVGPSGTGKTMTANAISEYTNKTILTINLNQGITVSDSAYSDNSSILSLIFREARINDAVLFFDESELLLRERMPDILLEIEKHEGIVIFATNASFKIDEAMRRRINLILDFDEPGPTQRRKIWEIHLPKKIKLEGDVDLDFVSKKYELNGGLIKNAVFSSLAHSVNRNKDNEIRINMSDLEYGAREQLQNKLFMSRMEIKRIPLRGIDYLILPPSTLKTIREIINFEKAKKVLDGEWGFKEIFPEAGGVTVLFHGTSGTGKTITAEAIAFETGKTLKIVNYAQVISMYVGGTEKALESLLIESADNNSIILFDEADSIFAKRTDVHTSLDRYANLETDVLLNLIERNNVFAILTTNHLESIDYAFFRRMRFIVEFKNPDYNLRVKIWEKLVPTKLPIDKNVSFDKLAEDYEFNGGDIKSAIIRAATKKAVNFNDKIKIDMNDFVSACNEIVEVKYKDSKKKIGFN